LKNTWRFENFALLGLLIFFTPALYNLVVRKLFLNSFVFVENKNYAICRKMGKEK